MGKGASEPIPFAGSQLGATRHVCAFFRNADEEYRVLLPFIQDGFESGDRAFHIVDPKLRNERHGISDEPLGVCGEDRGEHSSFAWHLG
jgi:hypothetical protein